MACREWVSDQSNCRDQDFSCEGSPLPSVWGVQFKVFRTTLCISILGTQRNKINKIEKVVHKACVYCKDPINTTIKIRRWRIIEQRHVKALDPAFPLKREGGRAVHYLRPSLAAGGPERGAPVSYEPTSTAAATS